MRDPKRIPEVLKDLQTIWENVPDWRLGQLICNIGRWKGHFDPFYMEDNVIHAYLSAMMTADDVVEDVPEETLQEVIEKYKK